MSRRYVAIRQWRSLKRFNAVAQGPYASRQRAITAARRAREEDYLPGDYTVALFNTPVLWRVRAKPETGEYGFAIVQAFDLEAAENAFSTRYPHRWIGDFEFEEVIPIGNCVVGDYWE